MLEVYWNIVIELSLVIVNLDHTFFQIRAKNIFFLITHHRNISFHRCLFFSELCCIYRNQNIERIHLPSSVPNTFHIVLGSYGTGLSHICRNDDLLVFRGCPDASRWSSIYLQLMVQPSNSNIGTICIPFQVIIRVSLSTDDCESYISFFVTNYYFHFYLAIGSLFPRVLDGC